MTQWLLMGILALYIGLRIAYKSRENDDPLLAMILIAAALIRLGVGLVNHYMGPLPGARIDAVMFDETARNFALFSPSAILVFEVGRLGYSSILALFYMLSGYHFLIPTLVNLVFIVEFLFLVYGIARRWGNPAAARIAVLAAGFYPTSVLYTAVPLREAPLLWGLALYVTSLLGYHDGRYRLLNWRMILSLAFLVWLHDGFALAVLMIPIAAWFKHHDKSIARRLAAAGVGAVAMVLIFVVATTAIDFHKLPNDPSQLLDPSFLADMREKKATVGVSYAEFQPTWGGIARSAPLLLFAFIASPFPFWVQGGADLFKMAEGILALGISCGALIALFYRRGTLDARRRVVLLSMFLFIVAVFAMGTNNTGIAARHRAKFLWMPIVVNALILTDSRKETTP